MATLVSILGTGLEARRLQGEHATQHLALALNEQSLYGAGHPAVLRAGEEIARTLTALLGLEDEFRITLTASGVRANGIEVFAAKSLSADIATAYGRHGLRGLTFRPGVTPLEVINLVHLLGTSAEEVADQGGLLTALVEQGVRHVDCEFIAPSRRVRPARLHRLPDSSLLDTCTDALGVIEESAQQARLGRMLNASAARTLASQFADGILEDHAKLLGLLSIRRHDEYTFEHSLNICILALALGMAMGFGRARLEELGLAALLHDVGKAWVPLEVLRKPGPLDDREFVLIKRHPVDGAVYLGRQADLPPAAALVAFQHHLRYDQHGYPPLRWPHASNAYSLIVGIADAYEALTSERPYRPTRSPEEALEVMLQTPPGQFEPRLLHLLVEMLGQSDLVVPEPEVVVARG